jgi:hypothetical protein
VPSGACVYKKKWHALRRLSVHRRQHTRCSEIIWFCSSKIHSLKLLRNYLISVYFTTADLGPTRMFARTHTLAYWKHCNTQRPQVSAASKACQQLVKHERSEWLRTRPRAGRTATALQHALQQRCNTHCNTCNSAATRRTATALQRAAPRTSPCASPTARVALLDVAERRLVRGLVRGL